MLPVEILVCKILSKLHFPSLQETKTTHCELGQMMEESLKWGRKGVALRFWFSLVLTVMALNM